MEGPNGIIFCILYWFYICFRKIDVRVCGGLPVFDFRLFYTVFLMISVNVTFHRLYIDFICRFRENWLGSWWRVSSLRFSFVLLWFVNDCGAVEGSTRSILLICLFFYKGFVKLNFKAFGWFSRVLKQIKVEDFQVSDFVLFYFGLLMIAVPWRGQNVPLYWVYIGFIEVSWNWIL